MEAEASNAAELDFEIGGHQFRFLPPDIFLIRWRGPGTTNDFEQLFTYVDRLVPSKAIFVVADVSDLGTIDRAVRKMVSTDPRMQCVRGLALLGASFHIRVLLGMMSKAMNFFHSHPRAKVFTSESEGEALAWIAKERAHVQAK